MVSAVEQIYTCLWLAVISNACVPAVKSVLIDEYSVNALLHSMSVYSGIPERVTSLAPAGRSGGLGTVCCLLWISNGFKRGHGLLVNHLSSEWWSDVMEQKWVITLQRNKQMQHTLCILLFFSPSDIPNTLGLCTVKNKWSLKRLSFHLKSPTALKVSVGKTAKLYSDCILLTIQIVLEE